MNRFLQNASDIKKAGGFGLIVKDAAKDMLGFGRMTGDNAADIKKIMAERDKLQAEMDKETRPLVRSNDSRKGDIDELNRYLNLLRIKQRNEIEVANVGQDFGDAVSRKFMRPESVNFDSSSKASKKASGAAPKESEYQRYLENLQKELDKTEELTRAAMVLADVNGGRLKLKPGEDINVLLDKAREIDANKALTEEKKRGAEFDAKLRDQRLADAASHEAQVKSLLDGNEAMRAEIALIGKNAEAQGVIEQARLSSLIAMKEQELAEERSTQILTRRAAALEEEIRLLNERKELVGLKGATQQIADDAKKTEELANSIGAAFSSSFEKAVIDGEKLSDVLKGLGKDIAALVLRQTITVPLSNSIAKALQTGTPTTGSGGSGGGGGFDFGSLISGVMKMFGGTFAEGGSPPVGKISLVGERGPELFVPNTAGKIIPNHALNGGGGSVTVIQNYTVGDVATEATVRQAVADSERRIAGQIGRSRQYGGALA